MGIEKHEVRWIGVGELVGHRLNANEMGGEVFGKLLGAIGRTGRYEPLVVRRHPSVEGKYEVINGHHRLLVLRELGHEKAACLVWELSDGEALMLLATVNRLSGKDGSRKRVRLLEALHREVGVGFEALGKRLPEGGEVLRRVLERGRVGVRRKVEAGGMRVALTVFMTVEEKKEVVRALREVDRDLGRAIVRVVREKGGQGDKVTG